MGWPSKTGPPARPDIPFGQGLAVLFAFLPQGVAGGLPRHPPEHEGECWDNACAESFFATLKREFDGLDGRRSAAEVRQSVFMYIETYYNRVCAHSAIDFVAPDVFNLGKVA